jgi:uncharacterized coiled-coil DUF342 family protein
MPAMPAEEKNHKIEELVVQRDATIKEINRLRSEASEIGETLIEVGSILKRDPEKLINKSGRKDAIDLPPVDSEKIDGVLKELEKWLSRRESLEKQLRELGYKIKDGSFLVVDDSRRGSLLP